MRPSRPIPPLAFALVLVFGAPVSRGDSPATKQWVVTSAKVTGAGGEQFATSLRIVNPFTAQAANVALTFLPQSGLGANYAATGDNSGATPVNVTVPAGQTLALDDVLPGKLGVNAGAGGIQVTSDIPVSVLSQTLVVNAKSATGQPGTNGFSIPAQTDDQAVAMGDVAFLPFLSSAPDGATTGYRTNVFFQNAGYVPGIGGALVPGTSVVNVALYKGDGMLVGQRDYTLGKLSQTQQNRIAASFGYQASDTNLTAVVTVKSGGPVVVGASVIDNAISSINYVPPTKIAFPKDGRFGLVLNDGKYDLSGQLQIVNRQPDYLSGTFTLTACPGSKPVLAFVAQAFGSGLNQNTSFTKNPNGTYSFSGGDTSSTWTGTLVFVVDGTVAGNLTYNRKSDAATCPGVTKDFPFFGAWASPFN